MNGSIFGAIALPSAQSRFIPLAFAGLLGLFVVGFAGFAQMEVLSLPLRDKS